MPLDPAELRSPWRLLASPRPWTGLVYLVVVVLGGVLTLSAFTTVVLIPVLLLVWPRIEQRILPLAGHQRPNVRRFSRFELRWRDWALVLLTPVIAFGSAAVVALGVVLPVLLILVALRSAATGESLSVFFIAVDSPVSQTTALLGGAAALMLGLWLVCAASYGWGSITSALLRDEETRLVQQVAQLSEQHAQAADQLTLERRQLERDLHDGAQMHLSAAATRLGMLHLDLENLPESQERERLVTGLGKVRDQLEAASTAVRSTVRGLVPEALRDGGLCAALQEAVDASPLRAALHCDVPRLHPGTETALYFIATESIANTLRHAQAETLSVDMIADTDRVTLSITDDGVGSAEPTGTGILGIQARARLLGGETEIKSPPGRGTTIIVCIPLRTPEPGTIDHQRQRQQVGV